MDYIDVTMPSEMVQEKLSCSRRWSKRSHFKTKAEPARVAVN